MTMAPARTGLRYTVDDHWGRVPEQLAHADVAAVDVTEDDIVYLFTRDRNGVVVLDSDGTVVTAWGDGIFHTPHGLTVAPDGTVYCVDCGDHTIRRFTPEGRLLQTIGTPGLASDTGYGRRGPTVVHLNETVQRPGGPFNGCTNLTVAPTGELFVADGYGNCRIHRLTAEGRLLGSWGGIGTGPGEFHLPHAICATPDGYVLVGDRENDRIQVFDLDGTYVTEWTDVQRPCDIAVDAAGLVYVAELWRPSGNASFTRGATTTDRPGRVTVFDRSGQVVARWGASTVMRDAPGNFIAPHGIAVDSTGAVYVAEVTGTFGVSLGRVPADMAEHQLQKFTPIG